MFTIKIVESAENGDTAQEQVFEASGVRQDQFGLHVDLDSGCATYGSTPTPGGPLSHMYVMNRFGATVANYRF